MSPFDLLAWSLALGATASGVVEALRALPLVQRAMLRRQKPWACDICMGFWTTGALSALLACHAHDAQLLLAAGPAYPVVLLFLAKLDEPRHDPPMPPLKDA